LSTLAVSLPVKVFTFITSPSDKSLAHPHTAGRAFPSDQSLRCTNPGQWGSLVLPCDRTPGVDLPCHPHPAAIRVDLPIRNGSGTHRLVAMEPHGLEPPTDAFVLLIYLARSAR
jgi:hypothetical protein